MSDLFSTLMDDESSFKIKEVHERVKPLQAEIELIPYTPMRSVVSSLLSRAEYFWTSPSSNLEDFYPPDEYRRGGLVEHTKRTVRAMFCIMNAQLCTEDEVNILLTAALLHGACMPVLSNVEEQEVYDHNYMVNIDSFISNAIAGCMMDKAWPSFTEEVEIKCGDILESALRLVHCCEGTLSPIPELYPNDKLELMMASANLVAKSIHVIADGVDIVEERWLLGTES